MKKLKITLQSKYLYIFLILFTFFYVLCSDIFFSTSKYDGTEQKIVGTINSIKIDDNKISIELLASEKILVNYYAKDENDIESICDNYLLGSKIKVTGNFKLPNKNTVFNLFNYRNYLKSKKIYWIFEANDIKKINTKVSIKYKLKNIIINKISKSKNSAYLYTFILGDTSFIDEQVKQSYQNNGISHLFSISGMHITLFTSIILFILNKVIKRDFINYFIITLFLIAYSFLTNFTPSIMRAIFLFIMCYINKKFNFNIKTYQLLIIICCLFLIYNPYYIYDLGFLFSFIVTFYLIIFGNLVNNYRNYFIKLFMTSLISFLAGLPIVINNFFNINILSIFLNLIFVSYVSIIIFPLTLLTFVFQFLSPILTFFISILEGLSLLFYRIRVFNISLSHINIYFFILYYIFITYILYSVKVRKYHRFIFLIIVILIHNNVLIFNNKLLVTFIDVGQGDLGLISMPHNKGNILIDTGGVVNYSNKNNNYSISLNKTIPYLKSIGIKGIDYLILTHGDYDHMGEAINLVNNFKVKNVIFNCGEYNDLENELIEVLDRKKIKYYSCIKELNIDKYKLQFLNTKEYDNENDNSNVIYTELDGYKFMFMGDAGVEKEKDILNKYNISGIDVLKIGHHGSKTSSSKEFINEINPNYSIISVGKNNRYGHPNKEVLNNLSDSKIYRTDQDGSIMFKIRNNKLKIKTCSS